jgi:hypothetical protein
MEENKNETLTTLIEINVPLEERNANPAILLENALQGFLEEVSPVLVNMLQDSVEIKSTTCGVCETSAMALRAYAEETRRAAVKFVDKLITESLIRPNYKGLVNVTGDAMLSDHMVGTETPKVFEELNS